MESVDSVGSPESSRFSQGRIGDIMFYDSRDDSRDQTKRHIMHFR